MFSAIKKFFVSFFQFSSHSSEAEEKIKQIAEELLVSKENEEKENLNEAENPLNSFEPQLGESRPVEYDVKIYECSQRTGTVTHLSENFGIIDGVIYFEMKNVSDTLSLQQGDEVVYSVYKVEESDLERVYKIYALKDKLWGFEDNTFEIKENDDNEPEDIAAISRELSGRVKKKIKRKLLIEPLNLWCNLDTVNATYIPVEGEIYYFEFIVNILH